MNTVRCLFLSDSHEGGYPQNACLHPRYYGQEFDQLWQSLGQWVKDKHVDFIIHGGDLIDTGTLRQVKMGVERITRHVEAPVYLCLGNHDLARMESMDYWREHHGGLLPGGQADYHWTHGPAAFYVMTVHWDDRRDFYWEMGNGQSLVPQLRSQQLQRFEAFLQSTDRPVVLTVHAPVEGVQPSQSGLEQVWHPPNEVYRQAIYDLARRYDHLRLILAGHSHATNHAMYDGWAACNIAAFNESPAQARLITITPNQLIVDTVSIAAECDLPQPLRGQNLWGIPGGPDQRLRIDWQDKASSQADDQPTSAAPLGGV